MIPPRALFEPPIPSDVTVKPRFLLVNLLDRKGPSDVSFRRDETAVDPFF